MKYKIQSRVGGGWYDYQIAQGGWQTPTWDDYKAAERFRSQLARQFYKTDYRVVSTRKESA